MSAASDNLRAHQKQLDEDGVMVGVSRQAVVETLEHYDAMHRALTFIAAMRGMTLIAPSLGPDADRGHQIGANKAFEQAADAANHALEAFASGERAA